tara:strand:- start:262 stop:918 length:657 start_codon:yes stop_codon:yes gene_type:complete
MKKSDLIKSIKEEIADILESASAEDVKAQQDYNAELEKTAQLTKDAGLNESNLFESLNPEVSRDVNRYIARTARRYDYSEQDAVYAIMAALKQREFDGLDEATVNEAEKIDSMSNADIASLQSILNKYDMGKIQNVIKILSSRINEEEDMDDVMDKNAIKGAKKGDSVSKIANKLQQTTKEMKSVVKKWKDAEGSEKEKLTNRLKELTKIKKELEGLL